MYRKLSNLENVYIIETHTYQEYLEEKNKLRKYLKTINKKICYTMPVKAIVITKYDRESK